MQLTLHTDYALRLLLFLAAVDRPATIAEIAESYGISRNHLVKVGHKLGKLGYIATQRGRTGGVSLERDPASISIGQIVRDMEPNFTLVECFDRDHNRCVLTPACDLKRVLAEAHLAFMASLDQRSLADITKNRKQLARLLAVTS